MGRLPLMAAPVLVLLAAVPVAAASPGLDFRAAANGACVRYDRATSALPQIDSAAELKRQLDLVPRLFRTMVERIAAAPPPPSQQARAVQLVASLRRVQASLARIRDAFLRGDRPGVRAAVLAGTGPSRIAARTATELRLPTCARLALAATKGWSP